MSCMPCLTLDCAQRVLCLNLCMATLKQARVCIQRHVCVCVSVLCSWSSLALLKRVPHPPGCAQGTSLFNTNANSQLLPDVAMHSSNHALLRLFTAQSMPSKIKMYAGRTCWGNRSGPSSPCFFCSP